MSNVELFAFILMLLPWSSRCLAMNEEVVKDWSITGSVICEGVDFTDVPSRFSWQLVRLGRTSDTECNASAQFQILVKNEFTITPADGKFNTLIASDYVIGAYSEGRVAVTEKFHLDGANKKIENLKLQFGAKFEKVLAVKAMDPVADIPIKNAGGRARLFNEAIPALNGLQVGKAKSDESGLLHFSKLPVCEIEIVPILSSEFGATAKVDGKIVNPEAIYSPSDTEEADPRVIYFMPQHKGMWWGFMSTEPPGARPIKAGSILEFAPLSLDLHAPQAAFRITVGDGGLVKTPVVSAGIYRVKCVEGDELERSVEIDGFGVPLSKVRRMIERGKKQN